MYREPRIKKLIVMSKYIDADKFIKKFEKMIDDIPASVDSGAGYVIDEVYKIFDSLQQEQPQVADASKMEQEVDLKKEYKEYVEDDPVFSKLTNRNVGLAIARHFWNKGYNSRNKK